MTSETTEEEFSAGIEITQLTYKETSYSDASWELIGEPIDTDQFVPEEFPVIAGQTTTADPMFADYGGRMGAHVEKRWHLPEHLATSAPLTKKETEEENESRIAVEAAELEQMKQEAYEAGRKAGLEDAVTQNVERLAEFEERIKVVLEDLAAQFSEKIGQVEREAVELSVSVGRKLLDASVEIQPEYIIPIINDALKKSGGASIRRVRVSPQDMEFIDIVGIEKQIKGYDGSWSFEADDTIRAGCIVDSSAGEVDFQLDKAWDRIRDHVLKVIR